MQFGWDAQQAAAREQAERLDRELSRHRSLARLGCLGVLGSGLVALAGGAALAVGLSSGEPVPTAIGLGVLGVGLLLGMASSAFNMTHFWMYYVKRAGRGPEARPVGRP